MPEPNPHPPSSQSTLLAYCKCPLNVGSIDTLVNAIQLLTASAFFFDLQFQPYRA